MSDERITGRIPCLYNNQLRPLTELETEKMLKQDTRLVVPYVEQKLEENAKKNWDVFYKRNTTKFFKDRHWTTSEFKEILGQNNETFEGRSLLEIGCGVGNMIFPLVEEGTLLRIYACDFSKRAVDFVKQHPLYDSGKITAFEGDITSSDFSTLMDPSQHDIITMVFVLSAVHPSKFFQCASNAIQCLKSGGVILIRDYAVNDMTQVRFKPGHKISENFYMRQDGTRTYFFTLESLRKIFTSVGFQEVFCNYVHSRTVNKKENIDVPRTFIQAKFLKPKVS